MTRHDLFGSFVLKLALSKWSHGSQREAHRYMPGYPRKGGGSAKNICIMKISIKKKKHIMKQNKKIKKYSFSPSKEGSTK